MQRKEQEIKLETINIDDIKLLEHLYSIFYKKEDYELADSIQKLKEKVSQIEPPVSLRLRHKYSGDDSKLFWKLVNAMGERQQEFYSLGVVLQNLESWILTQMKYEAPNFVEDEQASNQRDAV